MFYYFIYIFKSRFNSFVFAGVNIPLIIIIIIIPRLNNVYFVDFHKHCSQTL